MKKEYEFMLENVIVSNSVLDVGCGDGFVLNHLPKCTRKVGADINRPKRCNFDFIKMDFNKERFPFGDSEFDAVLCCEVLEHINNVEGLIDEMKRVGKKVVITTPNHHWQKIRIQKAENVVRHLTQKELENYFNDEGTISKRYKQYGKLPIISTKIGLVWNKILGTVGD